MGHTTSISVLNSGSSSSSVRRFRPTSTLLYSILTSFSLHLLKGYALRMLSVDHQQTSFPVSAMTSSYPHNSFDSTIGVDIEGKSHSHLGSMSPPGSASSASSHSQMLFAGEQNDFSQQANPFSHHPPPQIFPEVHHPTPSHPSNVEHAMTLNPSQLRSSIGPSRVLTRRQARAQQQQEQQALTSANAASDSTPSSQSPHVNALNEV